MPKRYEKGGHLIIAKQIDHAEAHIAIAVDLTIADMPLSSIDPDRIKFEIGCSEEHACHCMECDLGLIDKLNEASRCSQCGWIGADDERVEPAGEGFVTCPACGGHDFHVHFLGPSNAA